MADEYDFNSPPAERVTVRLTRHYSLTIDQEKELKEAFAMFDLENTGMITLKRLPHLMHTMAHVPTDFELNDIANEFDPDGTGEITMNDVMVIMARRYKTTTAEDEVILAFKVFDKEGNGFISEAEFRHIMVDFGDKMTEEEIEEILRDADSNAEGNIDYTAFVMMMAET